MRSAARLALFALLSMNLATDSANAAIEYELVQEASGGIMAAMVLDPDPQVRDIVTSDLPLTLTLLPLGASVIGLPEGTYTMNYVESFNQAFKLVDVGDGFLRHRPEGSATTGSSNLYENAPGTPGELAVLINASGISFILHQPFPPSPDPESPWLGRWVRERTMLPEPSSVTVWTICLVVGAGFGSLRRRRTQCRATGF